MPRCDWLWGWLWSVLYNGTVLPGFRFSACFLSGRHAILLLTVVIWARYAGICHATPASSLSSDTGPSPLGREPRTCCSWQEQSNAMLPPLLQPPGCHAVHLYDMQCWLAMKKEWTGRKGYDKNEWYGITETGYHACDANTEQLCFEMLNRWH